MTDWGDIRQLFFAPEFRIRKCALSADAVSAAIHPATAAPPVAGVVPERERGGLAMARQLTLFVEIGTATWRLRKRLLDRRTGKPAPETLKLYRHVEAIWDALEEAGVEVRDHTNEPFRTGLALDVIAFQPVPGLAREMIIETVKPSIFLKEHTLQIGKVIVGTPEDHP